MRKRWRELIHEDDAVSLVKAWTSGAPTDVALLDAAPDTGHRALEALQVTTRSALGAVALHTGGILVDGGWLRILGSGSPRLPRALDTWNGLEGSVRLPGKLLVADDALGGFFAWFDQPHTVHYLAPDTFDWEDTGLGYTDWLAWCFTPRLAKFYESLRWEGWRAEVEPLAGDQGLHVWPPLVMKGPPLAERSRRSVPVDELLHFALDMQQQLADLPDGATVTFDCRR